MSPLRHPLPRAPSIYCRYRPLRRVQNMYLISVEGRVPLASEGMTLVHSNYNGDDYLISFGGYNGRYNNESDTKEYASDGTSRVLEPEVELSHDGKIRQIAMDSADSVLVEEERVAKFQLKIMVKTSKATSKSQKTNQQAGASTVDVVSQNKEDGKDQAGCKDKQLRIPTRHQESVHIPYSQHTWELIPVQSMILLTLIVLWKN